MIYQAVITWGLWASWVLDMCAWLYITTTVWPVWSCGSAGVVALSQSEAVDFQFSFSFDWLWSCRLHSPSPTSRICGLKLKHHPTLCGVRIAAGLCQTSCVKRSLDLPVVCEVVLWHICFLKEEESRCFVTLHVCCLLGKDYISLRIYWMIQRS